MSKLRIPKEYRARLAAAATRHGFESDDAFAMHLVDRGLQSYQAQGTSMESRIAFVVDENGYSSDRELIEHLLERGLRAYEDPVDDPEKLAARLRGLGYIE